MSTVKKRASVRTDHQRSTRPASITAMPDHARRAIARGELPVVAHREPRRERDAREDDDDEDVERAAVAASCAASPERRRPIHNWLTAQTMHSATKACACVMARRARPVSAP